MPILDKLNIELQREVFFFDSSHCHILDFIICVFGLCYFH